MKTTVKLSFMMFVEWFIWGAWFVPLWLWLSKSGFAPGRSAGPTPVPRLLRSCRPSWSVLSLTVFSPRKKVLAVLMFVALY